MKYADYLSIAEARELYFARSGFNADNYSEKWVKLPFLCLNFYLPNFEGRKQVVPLHDIDHILTEYDTSWSGEWTISAFEIGAGCGKYWAGWFINLQGIIAATVFIPVKSLKAFARGRRSRGVYAEDYEALLKLKVGDARRELVVDANSVEVSAVDTILFFSIAILSAIVFIGPLAALATYLSR